MDEKQIPKGIKLIAILYFIFSIIFSSWSMWWFLIRPMVLIRIGIANSLGDLISLKEVISGIFLILLGIFGIFASINMWTGKNWARITSIILSCLGVIYLVYGSGLGSVYSTMIAKPEIIKELMQNEPGSIILVIIFTIILIALFISAIYLIFNKKVKSAFSQLQQ